MEDSLRKLVDTALEKGLQFAVYSQPGEQDIRFVCAHPEKQAGPSDKFMIYPFRPGPGQPASMFDINLEATSENFKEALGTIDNWPSLKPFMPENAPADAVFDKNSYCRVINRGVAHIRMGRMKKFVISRIVRADKPAGFDPAAFFLQLAGKYPNAFSYLFHTPKTGIWTGATFETLATYRQGVFKTMAMAGTQPIEGKRKWTGKEEEEQAFVSQYIENIFTETGISFNKSMPKTVESGPVKHIATFFEAKTDPNKARKLVAQLHPTPAVCGEPMEITREFIGRNEPHNRFYYTGYLGRMNKDGNFCLYVNLRCMKVYADHLDLYAGGGITKDSDCNAEWEETERKATTLLHLINQ